MDFISIYWFNSNEAKSGKNSQRLCGHGGCAYAVWTNMITMNRVFAIYIGQVGMIILVGLSVCGEIRLCSMHFMVKL